MYLAGLGENLAATWGMKPLSEDLRCRIIAARESSEGTGEVCQRFGVSRSSVERFWNQHRRTGHCRPKQIGGYRRPRGRERLDVQIGLTALWHRLDRLGLSYKKNDARRRARAA